MAECDSWRFVHSLAVAVSVAVAVAARFFIGFQFFVSIVNNRLMNFCNRFRSSAKSSAICVCVCVLASVCVRLKPEDRE